MLMEGQQIRGPPATQVGSLILGLLFLYTVLNLFTIILVYMGICGGGDAVAAPCQPSVTWASW